MRGRNMPRMSFKLNASEPRTLQGKALLTYTDLISVASPMARALSKFPSCLPSSSILKNVALCSYIFFFIIFNA